MPYSFIALPNASRTRNEKCTSHSSICMGPGATLSYVNPPDGKKDEEHEPISVSKDDGGGDHHHAKKSCKEKMLAYCTGKHFLGIFLIVLVAFIWVGASILIQALFGEYNYNKPYFLTYFNTSGFCFWNLGFLFCKSWREVPIRDDKNEGERGEETTDNGDYTCTDGNRIITCGEMTEFPSVTYPEVPSGALCAPTADYAAVDYTGPIEAADTDNCPTIDLSKIPEMSVTGPSSPLVTRSPIFIFKHESELNDKICLPPSLQRSNGSDKVTSAPKGTIYPKEAKEDVVVGENTTCPYSIIVPRNEEERDNLHSESLQINSFTNGDNCNDRSAQENQEYLHEEMDQRKPYSLYRIAKGALFFCPLWFLANVLFNYSLANTSVASNTILSTTSSIWTIVFSKLLLNQNICMWHKMTAVLFSITGTCLVALYDNTDSNALTFNTKNAVGNILALISAVCYASYTTVLKWALPDDDCFRVGMVFGFVGLWNIVLMWPGLVLLGVIGIETFELPSISILGILAANALIGTNLSDVMWAKSVMLISPLVATLGLSLTIPIAMVADSVLKGKEFSALYIVGAVFVAMGFVIVNLRPG